MKLSGAFEKELAVSLPELRPCATYVLKRIFSFFRSITNKRFSLDGNVTSTIVKTFSFLSFPWDFKYSYPDIA